MTWFVSLLAHAVHYGVLVAGAAVLGWLLLAIHRDRSRHDKQVSRLRAAAEQGTLEEQWRVRLSGDAGPEGSPRPAAPPLGIAIAISVATIGAAVIHAAVCPEHFEENTLFGVFFAVVALAQLGWGVLVLQSVAPATSERRRWAAAPFLKLGAAGSLGVALLWVVTRTVGLPWGLLPEPEEVGLADVASTLLEVLAAAGAIAALVLARAGGKDLSRPEGWRPSR